MTIATEQIAFHASCREIGQQEAAICKPDALAGKQEHIEIEAYSTGSTGLPSPFYNSTTVIVTTGNSSLSSSTQILSSGSAFTFTAKSS